MQACYEKGESACAYYRLINKARAAEINAAERELNG